MTFSAVGKNYNRLDSVEKVTGKAKYGNDYNINGLLHAKLLRSPFPHAKVVHIDTSLAKNLPGVHTIITPQDVPSIPIGPLIGDQFILCRDNRVRCVGDPVVAVAAETEEIAANALDLIQIDYEELPCVFDIEKAYERKPTSIVHPDLEKYEKNPIIVKTNPERPNVCQTKTLYCGDVKNGFAQADLIIENQFKTSRIHHCPLEGYIVDAWRESDETLTIRSSTQCPWDIVEILGNVFGLPSSKIRVLSPYVGGAFGAKGGIFNEAIAALLASKSGRPVRLRYSMEDMFLMGGHRAPVIIHIKDGLLNDGTIISREMEVFLGIGAYSTYSILLVNSIAIASIGTYRIPNFRVQAHAVYSNEPLAAPYRGFGSPEIHWAIESQMDMIAHTIKIDPLTLRKKNLLKEGQTNAGGMEIRNINVEGCLDEVQEWLNRTENEKIETDPWVKGRGIAINNKHIQVASTSVVMVKIWPDEIIEVRHSIKELGQGTNTCLAQIVMEEFGIPIEKVKMVFGDTAFCPYDFGTHGQRSLVHNGNALIQACQEVKKKLFELAGLKLNLDPKTFSLKDGKILGPEDVIIHISELFAPNGTPILGGEIVGIGSYTAPFAPVDPETGQSERSAFDFSYAAVGVEVAVNTESGEIKILRHIMACDIGTAINPKIVEQQMDGGLVMGMGSTILEEILMESGSPINTNLLDYCPPTSMTVPHLNDIETVIVDSYEPEGPYGAKGIGELTAGSIAPAIANAVFNAVGVRIKDIPLSRERVLHALKERKMIL